MFRNRLPPRAFAATAAIATLALTASACSGSPKPTNSTSATSSTNSAGPAKSSATLRIESAPLSSFTDNFNPLVPDSLANFTNATSLIYEPLLQWNLTKADSYYPWLASSFTWNSDGTAITFKLHPGVKWSDGQPLTAQDVASTFKLIQQNKTLNPNSLPITDATAADTTTVTITFSSPQYTNLYAISGLTYIVPQHVWSQQADPAHWNVTTPIGSGPYTLESFTPQGFTLKANPNYWQGAPKVSEVNFPSYASDADATQALENGRLDWTGNYIPNIDSAYAAKDPAHDKYYFPATSVMVLTFNMLNAQFTDPSVRRAISTAIDRTALSKFAETGYERPATSSCGLLLPEFAAQVPSKLQNDLPATADAAKASELLDAAGYTKGADGIRIKNSRRLEFKIEVPSTIPDYANAANLIAQQLTPLGLAATVDSVDWAKWDTDLTAHNFDLTIQGSSAGPTPYQQYDNWLDTNTSGSAGRPATGDYGRYQNPKVQDALKAWAATNDPTAITTQLGIVANAMSADMPDVPLLYGAGWTEYNTKNFTGWPNKDDSYVDPRPDSPSLEYTVLHLTPTP